VVKKYCEGVGLLELLVTIVVMVVLLNLAIPNFWNFIQSNRVTGETNTLVTAVNYARSEAVKRGEIVSICASGGESGCGGDWSDGWLVFLNSDGSGSPGDDDVLREWEGVASTLSLTMETTGTLAQSRLDFDDLGAVRVQSLDNFAFRWHMQPIDCDEGQAFRRTVDVSNVGRVQVLSSDC